MGQFWIRTWLEDDRPSFEYFRKITIIASLHKAGRGRDSSPSSLLIQYNTHAFCLTNIGHSSKRWLPPFLHSDTNRVLGHDLVRSVNKIHVLVGNSEINWVVILEYTFFRLFSNIEQISRVQKIQKKLCRLPYCCSKQPLLKLHCFLFCLMCDVQSGCVLFCSYLSPMICVTYFFFSTPASPMLSTPKRVSRRKDIK